MQVQKQKTKEETLQPFLKWVGGKRQLLPEIRKHYPADYNTYYEPMVGGGAVLFDLTPKKAVISDVNPDLIEAYTVIRDSLPELIQSLQKHSNTQEYFYEIRALDRNEELFKSLTPVERVSRLIYLNRTCFNGLYRVNKSGFFNVPFGKYKNPKILNEEGLTSVSKFLNENDIQIKHADFAMAIEETAKGDFVYIDPPYDPVSKTASFTSYSKLDFDKQEQVRIKENLDKLHKKGCKVLLSNSATDFIKDLYKDYDVMIVRASRNINSVASKRGKIDEVLIKNY